MTNEDVLQILNETFQLALRLSLPFLLVSMIIGIIIAIFQAATSINEQTMTFVPKFIAIVALIAVFGGTIMRSLNDFFNEIMDIIVRGGMP